jgi:predicted ribonuclease YlaK
MGNKYQNIRYKWLDERGFNILKDHDQHMYMQALWAPTDQIQAVFCNADAGTGKTTLAVLAGVYEIERGTYSRIIYLRSAVPVRDQGFLPGDLEQKEGPYMAPLIEAMDHAQPGLFEQWLRSDQQTGEPKVVPTSTSFTRGINWKDSFVIIDEAQNLDLNELQTALTRVHDSTKVVVIGSVKQVDNKKNKIYGKTPFEWSMEHFRGTPVAICTLSQNYRGWFSQHADMINETINGG